MLEGGGGYLGWGVKLTLDIAIKVLCNRVKMVTHFGLTVSQPVIDTSIIKEHSLF